MTNLKPEADAWCEWVSASVSYFKKEKVMKKKDMRERCVCGHLAGRHTDDPEMPCSVRIGKGYCRCDGLKVQRSKAGERAKVRQNVPMPIQIVLYYQSKFGVDKFTIRCSVERLCRAGLVFEVHYFQGMDHDTEYLDRWKLTKTRGWVLQFHVQFE